MRNAANRKAPKSNGRGSHSASRCSQISPVLPSSVTGPHLQTFSCASDQFNASRSMAGIGRKQTFDFVDFRASERPLWRKADIPEYPQDFHKIDQLGTAA